MEQQAIIAGGVIVALGMVASALILRKRLGKHNHSGYDSKDLANSLRDEKLKSDIILSAIEDGVVLLDDQKTIQLFNPGAGQISGWEGDEAKGLDYRAVLKLVDEKDAAYTETEDPFARAYNENAVIRDNRVILVTKSDKRISLSLSVSPLADKEGNVQAAVAVFRDISQQQAQEQQRAEFISTASHEMRTPVAAIEGYLALALNDKVSTIDARARGYLEKAHTATQHLGQLFQDLLTSAKAEDGRLTNHPTPVEIGQFLEQLAQDLKFTADKKMLGVDFVIGSHPAGETSGDSSVSKTVRPLYYTRSDPDRMREVITNVFDNAVKYTEQGKITIGLTGNDKIVQVYIKDTGPGIAPEDVPHLFQKFYRVDNSATRTIGGTGLGLFICRKIVELYGGKLWCESEFGKGSTFYINLPRLTPEQAAKMQQIIDQGATGV